MFKDGRLTKDPVLVELRKKYDENIGPCSMPGFNVEQFKKYEDYVEYCKTHYEQLMKERESKEQ